MFCFSYIIRFTFFSHPLSHFMLSLSVAVLPLALTVSLALSLSLSLSLALLVSVALALTLTLTLTDAVNHNDLCGDNEVSIIHLETNQNAHYGFIWVVVVDTKSIWSNFLFILMGRLQFEVLLTLFMAIYLALQLVESCGKITWNTTILHKFCSG